MLYEQTGAHREAALTPRYPIERFNPERDAIVVAQLYADVFAGPPWNEFTACGGSCHSFYGRNTQPGQPCPSGCGGHLDLAYPTQETAEYIKKEAARKGGIALVARNGAEPVGFVWGFNYGSPQEFAQEKYHTELMQLGVTALLNQQGIEGEFFYFSECGINPDYRGQGLSNGLSDSMLVEVPVGTPVVMRTNVQSPMVAIARRHGLGQIMGPEVYYDPEKKLLVPTGAFVNGFQDQENNDRVLYAGAAGIKPQTQPAR